MATKKTAPKKKSRKGYQELVLEHYRKEAKTHGAATTSTMADVTTRAREIEELAKYLKAGDVCLEVGCGNGSGSIEIAKTKKLDMTCIDFSPDLMEIAKQQPKSGVKGKISFKQQDILQLTDTNKYDVVFTERCIINLMEWEHQVDALTRMARALKKGGRLVLLETFTDGMAELNEARADVNLPPIGPAYHNLTLEKDKVLELMKGKGLTLLDENHFLSSYFFGTRVLYPALARASKTDIRYNSAFGRFFAALPNVGNYAHLQILAFKKK